MVPRKRNNLLLLSLALLLSVGDAWAVKQQESSSKNSNVLPVNDNASKLFPREMYDFLQCQVCHTPELSGSVQDSGCDYKTVDKAVSEHFHPLLLELSQLPFFRYFKVDLGKECPFWVDDEGMCSSIDCAVCECPPHEIPSTWYAMDQELIQAKTMNKDLRSKQPGMPCSEQIGEGDLSKVERKNAVIGENLEEWQEATSATEVWGDQSEGDENMVYINLCENPERYTGYSGYPATRIWNAIYQENCFVPPSGNEKTLNGMCFEERVYYRLISGLQASINTHIALQYRYGEQWATNTALFVNRVGKYPERIQNLYFTYLFVMRALGRYRNELLKYDFSTGHDADDARVREILRRLVLDDAGYSSCPKEGKSVLSAFDERALFNVQQGQMSFEQFLDAKQQKKLLEKQFREKFQNVSRIMDCVSCEKCRLWGKIQTMGIGTAIKILLVDEVKNLPPLSRNELIALINVANKLGRSVDGVRLMRDLEFAEAINQFALICAVAIAVAIGVMYWRRRRSGRKTTKTE